MLTGISLWYLITTILVGFTQIGQSSSGTIFPKNCTKQELRYKTVTVSTQQYYKTETCTRVWVILWKKCKYVSRSRTLTKTKIKPQYRKVPSCCPGYIEIATHNCTEGCLVGMYGSNCENNCTCPDNAEAGCEKNSGNCTCIPGKTGENCKEDCSSGWFGAGCRFPCLCINNSTCNPVDGSCNCSYPGYTGKNCEKACDDGKYGLKCSNDCSCLATQSCDHIYGDCFCKAGKKGIDCSEDCDVFTYGSGCTSNCLCAQENTDFCDAENGTCICNDGWEGDHCRSICSNGRYGKNCGSVCNCTGDSLCEPVKGFCLPDCFCNEKGTMNCDEQRETCNCTKLMKDDVCTAANLTTATYIKRFMTTLCNCKNGDTFCMPKNNSCICADGWLGDQCENRTSSEGGTTEPSSSTKSAIIGGVIAAVVIVLTAVVVVYVVWARRRILRNPPVKQMSNTAIRQVNNATYSSESQNVNCNENLDLKSDNEGIPTVYSVGKRIPNAQYENVLEYVCNDDYDHINVPEKTETANSC